MAWQVKEGMSSGTLLGERRIENVYQSVGFVSKLKKGLERGGHRSPRKKAGQAGAAAESDRDSLERVSVPMAADL